MILNKNVFELQIIDEETGDLLWIVPPQQITGLKFSKTISDVGNFTVTLFYNETLWNLFDIDLLVDVYTYNSITSEMELEETFFLIGRETYYENNIPQMVFFGESLDGLVLRRVIYPTTTDTSSAGGFTTRAGFTGDVLEQMFDEQMVNTDMPQRTFSNLTINKVDSGTATVGLRTRLTPLIDTLNLIVDRDPLMNWKFSRGVQQGIVITIAYSNDYRYSTIYPDTGFIIFSPDFGNVTEPRFKQTDEGSKTVIYVQGEGEGSNQELLQLSTPDVFQSIYRWVEVTAKSTRGEKSQSSAFQQALSVGLKRIQETKRKITFNFQIIENNSSFVYRRDFDIGDYVSFYWRDSLVNFKIKSTTFSANGNSVVRDFELEFEDE